MASLIPETWAVPERFKQRLGSSAGRQRAMIEAGHLLLILHGLPQPGDAERSARLFWRNPAGEWRATGAKGDGLKALKEHLEQYRKRVAELDEQVDSATSAQQLFQIIRHATPIARAARSQHRALQEAREGIDNRDMVVLRDTAGDIERSIELVAGDAKNALDFVDAKEAEAQTALARKATEAQHRLNMIAALFLPITAVGSVLGVNLRSGLEGQSPMLYWAVVGLAFATGFLVRASVTRGEKAVP
ncbi:MAG TPA: CorA family divalent cation transporter [Polyangiaceae bacterium]|nr:CorA family divalent cation transporter [Polyangiaceae bacterium]